MKARAPGKLVLSGAYSVLRGAPAVVAAVNRYVVADSERPAPLLTREVAAAMDDGLLTEAPYFDASQLRHALGDGESRKLGLGSSAAILSASLATARVGKGDLAGSVFVDALRCHRRAQEGGSGVDVAAACFGGVLVCRMRPSERLDVKAYALPVDVCIETWSCPTSASTRGMLKQIAAFEEAQPAQCRQLMKAASVAAEAVAAGGMSAMDWIAGVAEQATQLGRLGQLAGAPIVTPRVATLNGVAVGEEAAFVPSGAGGGDIALYLGREPSSAQFRRAAQDAGMMPLSLKIGAPGLEQMETQ